MFKEMSPNEKYSQCLVDSLPDGVLGSIFRHCPSESHETLRNVSEKWSKIVDRYVGRVLIVKCGNTFMVDPESNMDRMSIRTNYWMTLSRDASCNKNDTTEEENVDEADSGESENMVEEIEKLQDIPDPDSIRKIGFIGKLGLSGYKPLECILTPCKYITSLYLHMSIFSEPQQLRNSNNGAIKRNGPWSVSCILPHVKELVIDSSGIHCGDSVHSFGFKSTFLLVAAFLCAQKFTGLEKVIVSIPYMESTEGIIVRALCIFLGKHATSLKAFSYSQKYEVPDDIDGEESVSENEETSTSAEEMHHQGDGDRKDKTMFNFSTEINYLSLSQLAISAKELKDVKLEELHVVLTRRQESAPVWKNLMVKQNQMRKCLFAGDKIPIPQGTIEANAQILVILRLDIRDSVNLECFKACVNLKHLSLGGRNELNESYNGESDDDENANEGDEEYETGSWHGSQLYEYTLQLRNAKCLPSGLESLELLNLRTHKNDARIIALELPSLKDLTMKNLGWEGNLGLRLSDLSKIYEMGRLDHLSIKSSINMMSYSELEESTVSPELNLFACVLNSNSFTSASQFLLEVWKRQGEGGLYTTKKPSYYSAESGGEEELDVFQMPSRVELLEEEEESDSGSDSEDEEEETEDDDRSRGDESGGEAEEEMQNEEEADTDDEWQECEDEDEVAED